MPALPASSTRQSCFPRLARVAILLALGLAPGLGWPGKSASAFTQDFDAEGQREFRNLQGEVLALGTLRDVDGNQVTVNLNSGVAELRLNELSPEDRAWIREALKRRKLEREADQVRVELLESNLTRKPHLVYKVLRQLRGYGSNARNAGPLLLEIFKQDYLDVKTKREVLLTYLDTAPLDRVGAEQVLAVVAREWSSCGPLISSNPQEFLQTYSRFGESAADYLTAVAYSGELKPSPRTPPPPSPRNKELADETITRNRAAAARALAELKSERSLEIILEILSLIDRDQPQKFELDAQKVCLEAIGANGLANEAASKTLDRFARNHPEVVARVREKLFPKSDQ